MKQLYLHGLGQDRNSWSETLANMSTSDNAIPVDLVGLLNGKVATYENIYATFSEQCNKEEQFDLCGISLGGVLALNYAIDHPQKVHSLVLIAAQYKMPKILLRIQNLIFKFIPDSKFESTGFNKANFIQLCKTMIKLDFTNDISRIICPTLILCGEDDKANIKASISLSKK